VTSKLQSISNTSGNGSGHVVQRTQKASTEHLAKLVTKPMWAWDLWSITTRMWRIPCNGRFLFWDTLRQRGNQYLEHERAGQTARGSTRPMRSCWIAASSSVRSIMRCCDCGRPKGSRRPKRRPYIIIDPRAGSWSRHRGVQKDDSQIGVAIREDHPVYFVTFFPDPNRARRWWM